MTVMLALRCLRMPFFGFAIMSPVYSSSLDLLNVSVKDSPSNCLNAPARCSYADSQLTAAM